MQFQRKIFFPCYFEYQAIVDSNKAIDNAQNSKLNSAGGIGER